ncbi:hypothetical protein ACFQ60_05080 [Streptomyces zhihengii]
MDFFTVGEHHFLALEFVEGRPLNTFFARRHPLMEADPPEDRLADYTDWALRIHGLVEQAVAAVHARGIVFNDLHLFNIMVSEDESSVVLLDFEAAQPAELGGRQTVANPAFVAPADRRGPDVDRYALACLRIALFVPLTSLFAVDRAKAAHLARVAADRFPVPPGFLDEAVREITRDPATTAAPAHGGVPTTATTNAPRTPSASRPRNRATGPAAATRWCGRSWLRRHPHARTGSSPATSPSSPTPAAACPSATAPRESCTPCTRAAPTAARPRRSGSWRTPGRRSPARRWASTMGSPASPGPSSGSGTRPPPSTWPNSSSRRTMRRSPPTCTAEPPGSGSPSTPSPPPPARAPSARRPCGAPN